MPALGERLERIIREEKKTRPPFLRTTWHHRVEQA
jgi:hypothetical protein